MCLSWKFIKGKELIGSREFTEALINDGYKVTNSIVSKMIKGFISKNNCMLYPELDPNNPCKIWTLLQNGKNTIVTETN